ncbi:hypothetical protein FB548_0839 [Pseudoxanthomonas sp. 3HH-4]|uniref:hypothetical protein n=1 Tax=Pseudoxanthomonas sp. 3HH-4 TaxID=1690214 RepID=UPI001150E858|nr:hypothetical protein [Pseudoxanthomonas sp. 3HH-4]TQM17455.1 hypothetical protein FB548_0839 [Pseudoxanthomonas sp. 3HH-4]
MTTFTESHARLSYKSYDPGNTGIDTDAFELVIESNRASGYRGFIFRNNITKDYVVANTGTEFDTDKIRDGLLTDGQMVLADVNQQLDDARDLVELAIEMAKRDGTRVTVTGHSLGGFHTQVTCHEYGLKGETFNAYGAAGLYDVPVGGSQVINHVRATDMVGAANRHFGEVRVYATQQDVDTLLRHGPLPSQQNRWGLIQDLRELGPDTTHGAVQFHSGQRKPEELAIYGPNTIINSENRALYEQHKPEFDAYRESIRSAAEDVALATKLTGAGIAYTSAIGSQYVMHKVRHGLMGNEVHDELRELRLAAQRVTDERNRDFVPPDRPLIYRDGAGSPLEQIDGRIQDLRRAPTGEDSQCKPERGSGWPSRSASDSTPSPVSLRDDPLAYIHRMVAAYDAGDLGGFRRMTQVAANDPYARRVSATAAGQVDAEERQQALLAQVAEQQSAEQRQVAVSAGIARTI